MKAQMTLTQAMAVAVADIYNEADWLAAERVFKQHRLCPHCACDGRQVNLGRLQESTLDTYAGRECPECEEFVCDPGQDRHFNDCSPDYDTDASGMCFSDADPGL